MATRIESFTVTIPAGTLKTAPVTVATSFNDGEVETVEIDIPPGSSGLMGFALAYGAQIMIPHDGVSFIVANDRFMSWSLANFPTGQGWTVHGYNTDIYDHSIFVRYLINDLATGPATSQTVSISAPPPQLVMSSSPLGVTQ